MLAERRNGVAEACESAHLFPGSAGPDSGASGVADWVEAPSERDCMRSLGNSKWLAGLASALLLTGGLATLPMAPAALAYEVSPIKELPGRWVGEGRLGVRDGKIENVKCRVTYFVSENQEQLKQTIRCASAGGNIEVQSLISHVAGALSGTWTEQVHNLKGEMTGEVTKNGFRVVVKGPDFSANMDIIFRNEKQIVEIQFINSSLVGLTLVLAKG
jgi:hypothetical protein